MEVRYRYVNLLKKWKPNNVPKTNVPSVLFTGPFFLSLNVFYYSMFLFFWFTVVKNLTLEQAKQEQSKGEQGFLSCSCWWQVEVSTIFHVWLHVRINNYFKFLENFEKLDWRSNSCQYLKRQIHANFDPVKFPIYLPRSLWFYYYLLYLN